MKQKVIPIFFAVDDNYTPLLAAAINSLAENASDENLYNIHILNLGLSQKSKAGLSKYGRENICIFFDNVKESVHYTTNLLHTRDYYSKTTYFRMFIANMFKQYDKALYLDSDIIITSDIADLYNLDLKQNLVAAATESVVCSVDEFIAYSEKHLGIDASKYFNAGILVMNLSEFRRLDIEEKFYTMISRYTFTVAQDQDYLNVLCKDKVLYLDHSWNKVPDCPVFKVEKPNLIHFKLCNRPWQFDGVQFDDLFWRHAKECPFYAEIAKMKKTFTAAKKEKSKAAYITLKNTAKAISEKGLYLDSYKSTQKTAVNQFVLLNSDGTVPA